MEKSEIIKRVQVEARKGRLLFLASKQVSDPKMKLELDKRAAIHYLNAHRLLKKVNG
jgi:hydroxyacyl-ACP dehydratase HTD2-like protein with hotdog domain